MTGSGRILGVNFLGKRVASFLLLVAFCILAVVLASPQYFSAKAAGWANQVFGDFRPGYRPGYRKSGFKARQRANKSVRQKKSVRRGKARQYGKRKTKSRRARAKNRKIYSIGRISRLRLKSSRKKRLTYRIRRSGSSFYASGRKTYRSMCVRTCDGYFFPVSFSTAKGNLKKDANVCQSSCGVPASLYYYPNPGGDTKDMVAYKDGKKYEKLKNAFLFKKEFVADCRCKPEPWTRVARLQHKQYAKVETKTLKKLAWAKTNVRKKRASKRRYKKRKRVRRYSRLSKRSRRKSSKYSRKTRKSIGRYIRTSGSTKKSRRKRLRWKNRVRTVRSTRNWTF